VVANHDPGEIAVNVPILQQLVSENLWQKTSLPARDPKVSSCVACSSGEKFNEIIVGQV
jgi:hypothetical protein